MNVLIRRENTEVVVNSASFIARAHKGNQKKWFRDKKGNVSTKIILIVMMLVLSSSVSFGQLQFGVVAGVNTSTQSGLGDIWDNDGMCCLLNSGIMARYEFNDWLAIKSGLLYTQKGRSLDIEENGLTFAQKEKFNYLQIPVRAEFSAPFGKRAHRFIGHVGPYTALLLDSKKKIDDQKYDLESQTYDADFGFSFGFGVEVPFGENLMQVLINYDMGLSEVAKYDEDLRNKSLSLNVAWYF